MEPQQPDWCDGLPAGILGIVARAGLGGGNDWTKVMRGVCQTWKEEFELCVTKLTIEEFGPPPLPSISIHFPSLTSLDIGRCFMDDGGLGALAGLKRVVCLTLGTPENSLPDFGQLPRNLTGAGLALVCHLPLTSLDLSWCDELEESDLACLEKLPLVRLILEGCQVGSISIIRGLSLAELNLGGCDLWDDVLNGAALEALNAMPLTRLNLNRCQNLTPSGLEMLARLPITDFDLSWCDWPSNNWDSSILFSVRSLPLKRLILKGWGSATIDKSLAHIRDLPLERLDLGYTGISDTGLVKLSGMPLVSLNLCGCHSLTVAGFQHLRGLPLARLNVCFKSRSAIIGRPVEIKYDITGLVGDVLPSNCVITYDKDFVV